MKRIFVLGLLSIALTGAFAGEKTEYRDKQGRLLYVSEKKAERKEYRDKSGRLIATEKQEQNATVIRDKKGNIVAKKVAK